MSFGSGIPSSLYKDLEALNAGVKITGALAGVFLTVKGLDGASNVLNPVYAGLGGLLATPAVVSGILKDVTHEMVSLTKNFKMSAGNLGMAGMALASVTMLPLMSVNITNQAELHAARLTACNGAKEGRVGYTFEGRELVVDCKTMMAPAQ